MKSSYALKRLVRKAENLERKIEYDLRKTGSTPIEVYMNRCLIYAEKVNDLIQVSEEEKIRARRRIFKVYFNLQDYSGAETTKEEHLEEMMPDLDLAIVESYSAEVRTGGMGFSSANNVMMTGGLGAPKNPYWNAGNYAKAKKIVDIDTSDHVYKPKQTMVQWKESNKQEKKEILDE